MPRKKFEEEPYEPVKAELLQSVAALGRVDAVQGNPAVLERPPLARHGLAVAEPTVKPKAPVGEGRDHSSSVVSLRRAVAPATNTPVETVTPSAKAAEQQQPDPEAAPVVSTDEDGKPIKRFQVTADEDYELREFIHRLQRRSASKVSLSTLTRAALTVAMRTEQELNAEIDKVRPLPQPSNNDPEALARFEERWVMMLAAAFRKMRPMW